MSIEFAWDPTCYANIDRVALPLNDKPDTAIYGVFLYGGISK